MSDKNMDLKTIQNKIEELEKTKGWENTPDEKITFLVEELGEVAKWIRQSRQSPLTKNELEELNLEFADVLQHLISLANHYHLNLEDGLIKKKFSQK
jgi:NTP pyrophosphatase (non-canonical NTP hydrolase)